MFAKRLIVNDLGTVQPKPSAPVAAATPPATAVQTAPAGPGLAELRQFLRAAQSAATELAEAEAKAAKARDWAAADVDRARSALDEHADLDGRVTRHLASLARAQTGGAGRTVLPQDMQDSRRAQHEAATNLNDAQSVLELLTSEAATAARDLEKARIGAAACADVVAQHVALSLIGRLKDREREAGELRVLISGFGSTRSLGAPAVPWPITQLLHDPHHAALIDAATGSGAGNGAAVAAGDAWARYRVALLADPAAVFAAGPA